MKQIFLGIILFIFLIGCENNNHELKITYIANCSFLYTCNDQKVLTDPFGTKFGSFFYLPPDSVRSAIDKGKPPFNDINLLLITHIHGDHFDPFPAESYLLKNPETKMICPRQVYQQMKDSCSQFSKVDAQIISPAMEMDEMKDTTVNNIPVTLLRMQHGTDRSLVGVPYSDYTDYEKTENFGYIIHLDHKNIFHQGDADLSINGEALKQIKCPIDIAYLGFFDWDSTSYDILKNKLKAEHVIFMHGTKPAKELNDPTFISVKPQIIFFAKEMECKTFD